MVMQIKLAVVVVVVEGTLDGNRSECTLIDVAIPSDKNVSTKVSEKLSKNRDLEIEITKMWEMKTEIIPVVVGALGVIKKCSEKFVTRNGKYFTESPIHQLTVTTKKTLKCPGFKVWIWAKKEIPSDELNTYNN